MRILVVGATGFLGRQIVNKLILDPDLKIRGISRKPQQSKEIEWVMADMLNPNSLDLALKDIDVVISSANGYMKESIHTDFEGNKNLIDAIARSEVKRFVFLSIVDCHNAIDVPHFHTKALAEEHIKKANIPYVFIRAPAFLDQSNDYLAKAIKKGKFYGVGDKTTAWSYVLTEDLADYLAQAAKYPNETINNQTIDVGWSDGAKSQKELAQSISSITGKPLSILIIPWFIFSILRMPSKWFSELAYDFIQMFLFFKKGSFISNIELQNQFFGAAPNSKDVINRWLKNNQLL